MGERKPFLLRIDSEVLDAIHCWAADELRSLNGQIEYVLRRGLIDSGRLKSPQAGGGPPRGTKPSRSRN